MGKSIRVFLILSTILFLNTSLQAVNTGSKWFMLSEEYVTINSTGQTVTANNTTIRDIYVAFSPSKEIYFTNNAAIPVSGNAKVSSGGFIDMQTTYKINQKVGMAATSDTAKVTIWRYMLTAP